VNRLVVMLTAAALLAGCLHKPVDEVGPSIETVRLLRATDFPPVALGEFVLVPGPRVSASRVAIRGSTLRPPKGGTFATFLRDTMAAELAAAGRLNPSATVRIEARLTENRAGEDMAKGAARLSAIFRVVRAGRPPFDRSYDVENRWSSSFIGALAIPEAFNQYNALYGQLARKALSDPEFIAALR
jgi:hypothetical protein